MLQSILGHWKSTLFSVISASLAALAVTANVNSMTPKQLLFAYGACLALAIKGALSADGDKVALPPAK